MKAPEFEIVCGDSLDVLKGLQDACVHAVVTSPPYYGLRDYKSPHRVWRGSQNCAHEWGDLGKPHHPGQVEQTKWKTAEAAGKGQTAGSGRFCSKCEAWQGAFGLEPTPEMYVENAVLIFREVRRVLRDDGSFWLNIGDSYATTHNGKQGTAHSESFHSTGQAYVENVTGTRREKGVPIGYKNKDLIGIPWMLAFALRADGWYLRSDNCWAKLNAMPESVMGMRWERCRKKIVGNLQGDKGYRQGMADEGYRAAVSEFPVAKWEPCSGCEKCTLNDGLVLRRGSWRPTRAHEMVFQFTKSADYYSDGEAVKEPCAEATKKDKRIGTDRKHDYAAAADAYGNGVNAARTLARNAIGDGEYRNKRSVWLISSQPFREAHFAVFPPALVEPCILSSTSEYGVCGICGAPYARVIERTNMVVAPSERRVEAHAAGAGSGRTVISGTMLAPATTTTTGWRPTCACKSINVPALVLDPFSGAGTTGLVATKYGRDYIGIDLNADYCEMARKRIAASLSS